MEPSYSNEDGLFSGLPKLSEKVIKSTNRLRVSKEQSLKIKLAKVQARQGELAAYENKLQADMASLQAKQFHLQSVSFIIAELKLFFFRSVTSRCKSKSNVPVREGTGLQRGAIRGLPDSARLMLQQVSFRI